jgi:hypothetical protein
MEITIFVAMICSITAPDSYICAENAAFCTNLRAKAKPGASTNMMTATKKKDGIMELKLVDCQSRLSKRAVGLEVCQYYQSSYPADCLCEHFAHYFRVQTQDD